jgi:hypothetical protein
MQSAQPKDSPPNNSTATQLKTPSTVAVIPAHTKAIFRSTQAKSVPSTSAKDASAASDEAKLMNTDTKDVLSAVAPRGDAAGSEQVAKPIVDPSQPGHEPAASQAGSAPLQSIVASIPPVAIDASAVPDTLNDKLNGKAIATSAGKSTKKSLHAHEASIAKVAAPQPQQGVDFQVTASIAQQNPADTVATTAAPVTPGPTTTVASLTHAVPATRALQNTVQNGESAPAAKSVDVTPAATQLASAQGVAAVQTDVSKTTPADDHAATPSTQNVFAEALAPSAAVSQLAAVFVPSLTTQIVTPGGQHASADISTTLVASADLKPDAAIVQAAPVRRLEIAVNDPLLGKMDVRAEMRGGALHATVIGTQDTGAASMPALHQFLQQHDVTVHTLTYTTAGDGVAATGSAASSSSDMGSDTAGRTFSGGAGTGSQQSQGDRSQPQEQRYGTSGTGHDEHLFVPAYTQSPGISMAADALPNGSTLSIHI